MTSPDTQQKREQIGTMGSPQEDFGSKFQELLQRKGEDLGQMIKAPFQPVSASYTAPQELQEQRSQEFQEKAQGLGWTTGESAQQVTPQQVTPTEQQDFQIPELITQYEDKPPFPEELMKPLFDATTTYNVDPNILAATLAQETGGTGYKAWKAVGPDGEVGIAQIIPKWWYQYGNWPNEYNERFSNEGAYTTALREDTAFSIMDAARILEFLLQKHDGDYSKALAEYNAGGNLEAGAGYAGDILGRSGR